MQGSPFIRAALVVMRSSFSMAASWLSLGAPPRTVNRRHRQSYISEVYIEQQACPRRAYWNFRARTLATLSKLGVTGLREERLTSFSLRGFSATPDVRRRSSGGCL